MDPTEEYLRSVFSVGVGRAIHPTATGMQQVHRSTEWFGTAHGSVGLRAPATGYGPIYCLPASDSANPPAVLTTDGASNLYWSSLPTLTTIGASLGSVGSTLAANTRAFGWVPFPCTIKEVVIFATPTGSVTVGIWATSYAQWPPSGDNSLTGTATPAVSSGVKYKDTTLSTWTTHLASDMGVMFNIDSVSAVQQLTCTLKIVKEDPGHEGQGGDGGIGNEDHPRVAGPGGGQGNANRGPGGVGAAFQCDTATSATDSGASGYWSHSYWATPYWGPYWGP